MNAHVSPSNLYLDVNQVAIRYNVSKDSIYRWKREGNFPKAFKFSNGTTRWLLSDIEEYESRLEIGFATELSFPTFSLH